MRRPYTASTCRDLAELTRVPPRPCSKLTRLEISNVAGDTLELVAEVPLWSSVAAIQSVHLEVRRDSPAKTASIGLKARAHTLVPSSRARRSHHSSF